MNANTTKGHRCTYSTSNDPITNQASSARSSPGRHSTARASSAPRARPSRPRATRVRARRVSDARDAFERAFERAQRGDSDLDSVSRPLASNSFDHVSRSIGGERGRAAGKYAAE